tara:strand:+ start:337 stop:1395 length:1059 start_codon:yes stop_codon:yes gene_type:complete
MGTSASTAKSGSAVPPLLSKDQLHDFQLDALALASICDPENGVWVFHSGRSVSACQIGLSPMQMLERVLRDVVKKHETLLLESDRGFWVRLWNGHAQMALEKHVKHENANVPDILSLLCGMYTSLAEKRVAGLHRFLDIEIVFFSGNRALHIESIYRHCFPRFYPGITDLTWKIIQASQSWRPRSTGGESGNNYAEQQEDSSAIYNHYVREIGFNHLKETVDSVYVVRLCELYGGIIISQIVTADLNLEDVLTWVTECPSKLSDTMRGKSYVYANVENLNVFSLESATTYTTLLEAWAQRPVGQKNMLEAFESNVDRSSKASFWYIEWTKYDPWTREDTSVKAVRKHCNTVV